MGIIASFDDVFYQPFLTEKACELIGKDKIPIENFRRKTDDFKKAKEKAELLKKKKPNEIKVEFLEEAFDHSSTMRGS